MKTVRRIVRNSGASFLERISTPAASFVLVFFIARLLGVNALGKYSSALALLFIFQAIASLGFPYFITREVAQDKSKADIYLTNASFLGFFFAVGITLMMCLSVNLITDDKETIHAAYILSISLTPYTLGLVCQSVCRGFERLDYNAISLVTANTIKMVLGIIVLFKGFALSLVMAVITLSHFLIWIISLYFALRCIKKPIHALAKINLNFCMWMIKATTVFALILVLGTVRMNIDVLILNKMLGETGVGFYSASYKLVNIFSLGISCYIMAVQPFIFRLYKTDIEKFVRVCTDSVRYIFIIMVPIIVGVSILSEKIIFLVYKAEFLPSADVLCILVWILLFSGINQIFANALIAGNLQKLNFQANLLGMVSNIILNVLLIPILGFIGAAVANIASTFFVLIFQSICVSKYLFKTEFLKLLKKPFFSSVIMGGAILLFRDINLFYIIPISFIIYLLCIITLKTFSEQDLNLAKQLLRDNRNVEMT